MRFNYVKRRFNIQTFNEISEIIKKYFNWRICVIKDLPDNVQGRINYIDKIIYINFRQKEIDKVLTLVHEAGHMLHYLRNKDKKQPTDELYRELCAYFYGWLFNVKYKIGIDKQLWKYFHVDILNLF